MPESRLTPRLRPSRPRPAAPGLVIYDGACPFCRASVRLLHRIAPEGSLRSAPFQQPGVVEGVPGLSRADCERAVQFVDAAGRIGSGAEAMALGIASGRVHGALTHTYYLPLIRSLADAGYEWVARTRGQIGAALLRAGLIRDR